MEYAGSTKGEIILWRVIKQFVPTRAILKQLHDVRICGANEESIQHALFECTWAWIFWQETRNNVQLKIPSFHPNSWAKDMVDSKEIMEEDLSMILCGC
jgi:hypothetical protein